jgi:hypothetical protein
LLLVDDLDVVVVDGSGADALFLALAAEVVDVGGSSLEG